jgi:hypothetical protein
MNRIKKITFWTVLPCALVLFVVLVTIKFSYWRIVTTQKYFEAPLELSLEVSRLQDEQKKLSLRGETLLINFGTELKLSGLAFDYCYLEEHSFPRWFVYDFLRVEGGVEERKIPKLLKNAAKYRESHPITDEYFVPGNWDAKRGVSLEEYLQGLGDYPELLKKCWEKIKKDTVPHSNIQ